MYNFSKHKKLNSKLKSRNLLDNFIVLYLCKNKLHYLNFSVRKYQLCYISFKLMKKRNTGHQQTPSRVLLVCVYDTVVLNITNQTVYARFSSFGNIIKILIFQRGEVTKFFLQFSDILSAQNAKNSLDGAKLFQNICKMNIYYSNFRSVDLKHETTQGVSLQPTSLPAYSYPYFNSYPNYPTQSLMSEYNPIYCHQIAIFQPFVPLSNYPTLYSQFYNNENSSKKSIKSPQKEGDNDIERNLEHEIDWLLRSDQKKQNFSDNNSTESAFGRNQIYCFICFNIKESNMTNRQIYNLLSNFGNISFIKKTKFRVYIKFRSCQFSAIAKNYLTGCIFMGNTLDLDYITDVSLALPRQNEYAEVTYFDPSFDRFTNNKSISINPPSKTLHVSSIRRQACRIDLLREVFEQFGEVEGVEVLPSGLQKNMALVQFVHIEDSFFAISQMHNSLLNGRKIQISFTKSKLY